MKLDSLWVVLKVEREGDFLRLDAEDDRGRNLSVKIQAGEVSQRVLRFRLPVEIEELIGELTEGVPTLDVFIELGPRLKKEVDRVEPELSPTLEGRVEFKPLRDIRDMAVEAAATKVQGPFACPPGGDFSIKGSSGAVSKPQSSPEAAQRPRPEIVEFPERPEIVERPERPERPEWPERPDPPCPSPPPDIDELPDLPRGAEQPRPPQERRVDVALLGFGGEATQEVPTDSSLRRNGLYQLRVHVGKRKKGSLMKGKVPPLDPLLPESRRGHTLHVVVFEKDFDVLSPRVQPLFLPDVGGSEAVYFDLRAPEHKGPAQLRLKVYHENQLLQSFVLDAVVAEREKRVRSPRPALSVELAYSRTVRFANLQDFKPRALSIGVNQDADGSHLFQFKVGNAADAIKLTEEILKTQMDRFRKVLQKATLDASGDARFPTYPEPGTPPSKEFFQVIRELAEAGHELHGALMARLSRDLKDRLRAVARSADETLQFVRDDPNFVFPWTVIYDFGLPVRIAGAEPPPVCLGIDPADPARRCSHKSGDKVFCINGFWGIRHVQEVLLARAGELEDEVQVVERPTREAAICLAFEPGDEDAQDLAAKMAAEMGSAARVVGKEEDLVNLLWDTQRRPALLILLGHLETQTINGEPEGPRIVLVPGKKWFQADPVSNREFDDGSWNQPRSVVLLMACGSAATEVSTLNNFVMAFSGAGAGAVVGTECLVFSRLVSRFAREVAADLWNGKAKLGEAIRQFRRRLVEDGNPLGFVFTAAGNADLVLKVQE